MKEWKILISIPELFRLYEEFGGMKNGIHFQSSCAAETY